MRRCKVRSMVGLIPLFAVETLEPELLERLPAFTRRLEWFLEHRPDLAQLVSRWQEPGTGERRLLSLLRGHRMKQLLAPDARRERVPVADYGVRSLSRHHRDAALRASSIDGATLRVRYEPGESRHAACSAATPTGAARSGSRSTTSSSSRCSSSTTTTATTSRSNARPARAAMLHPRARSPTSCRGG